MAADATSPNANANSFLYMGEGGAIVPNDVVRVRVHPSVTVIPRSTFLSQTKLEEVEFCEGLLEIGKTEFKGCVVLKRIKIPSTITVIPAWAFSSCSQLAEVELCEGIQEIHGFVFFSCRGLTQINIPTTVKRVADYAFHNSSLVSIHLPDGIETI